MVTETVKVVAESAPPRDEEDVSTAAMIQLAQKLLVQAQNQHWRLGEHYKFVKDLRIRIGGLVGTAICLVDDPAAFDHAIDVDSDPELPKQLSLLERAQALCADCPVKERCLENSYAEPHLLPGMWAAY